MKAGRVITVVAESLDESGAGIARTRAPAAPPAGRPAPASAGTGHHAGPSRSEAPRAGTGHHRETVEIPLAGGRPGAGSPARSGRQADARDGGAATADLTQASSAAVSAVFAIHVPDLLPGEAAEVRVEHVSPHRPEVWATIVRRTGQASAERAAPVCPGFGQCGGCSWQHLAYPAQLREKRARLVAALAGVVPAEAVPEVRPSPRSLGYRNKGKYVVGGAAGALLLGAYAPRSHAIVDTAGCRVVAPAVDEVAAAARRALDATGLAPFDEASGAGHLRYVVVRAAADGSALVVLVTRTDAPRPPLDRAAAALMEHRAVRGVIWLRHDRPGGVIIAGEPLLLAGVAALSETIAGVEVAVGAGEFLQVNREQAGALYAAVAELAGAGPGLRAVDLYCGLGGIAFAMARAGARVLGIERDPDAVAAASTAAAAAGLADRLTFRAGDIADARADGQPDIVVVDPPRKGLAGALPAVAALAAPTLIYVSCGPESLGRDLTALLHQGYRLDRLLAFDLMPGTPEVETLALLRR
jgi:23S rRNA (uracil1939-C5)-methyltransferase